MRHSLPVAVVVCLALVLPALAQTGPDFGLDFVTVGAAGNRAATAAERNNAFDQGLNYGAVDHEFRITRTETTADQWIEFVRAYAPFYSGNPADFTFTGPITYLGNGQYGGGGQGPTYAGWQMAARYCNWLCNGKVNQAWAFESGAYDTSTFTVNPDGTRNDQIVHTPGARFWIPSFEETFKAFYYDPNRYGLGQDGYWMYPNASNVAPVSGPPGEGTTNTGTLNGPWWNVGSYPNVQSPWGLLDASGGEREWTEYTAGGFSRRAVMGTSLSWFSDEVAFWDSTEAFVVADDPTSTHGFRIASIVPSPGAWAACVVVALFGASRRRKA